MEGTLYPLTLPLKEPLLGWWSIFRFCLVAMFLYWKWHKRSADVQEKMPAISKKTLFERWEKKRSALQKQKDQDTIGELIQKVYILYIEGLELTIDHDLSANSLREMKELELFDEAEKELFARLYQPIFTEESGDVDRSRLMNIVHETITGRMRDILVQENDS